MSQVSPQTVHAAREIHAWFERVLRLLDRSVFAITPEGPHRQAAILETLTRNVRIIRESPMDRKGSLYSPLCFTLSAACRRLRLDLGVGHWQAALTNVVSLAAKTGEARQESMGVGLDLSTPAALFKQHLDEALLHSGLAGIPSILDLESRQLALGLSVNWGIRFLLAYALECVESEPSPERQDLAWMACLVRPLLGAGSALQAG